MSEVIADLIQLGLQPTVTTPVTNARGMPVVSVGRSVTAEDVRSLDDDE